MGPQLVGMSVAFPFRRTGHPIVAIRLKASVQSTKESDSKDFALQNVPHISELKDSPKKLSERGVRQEYDSKRPSAMEFV